TASFSGLPPRRPRANYTSRKIPLPRPDATGASLQQHLGERADRLDLTRPDEHRPDRRGLPRRDALGNTLARADQRDLVDQLVGNRGGGLVIAGAPRVVVVEILVARAHPANIQSEVLLDRLTALGDVGTHHAGHERRDVELVRIAPARCPREAALEMRLEQVPALWIH